MYTDSNLYHDENATTINTTFYRDLSLFTLNIPFSNDIQTDIYQESNIEERFAEKEKVRALMISSIWKRCLLSCIRIYKR